MAKDFFNKDERKLIVDAIKEAELNTSGEIRVHIDSKCEEDVMDRAAYWFEKLQMHKTELRNGVLFYLAYEDHKFAILGDAGINQKVDANFWEKDKETMLNYFKQGEFAKGLSEGIKLSGEQLKVHFPYQSDDVNELSDEISFGK
ncbi:TPM domain-containing protein [Saccharicrinis aurantiacus]|uniref:TPM domain-containing protein n=1 Tax=Saccharicrinis aurantiacus TaxID=1849719 RepID=UPI00094F5173|nr:TPM domain-containing protein [Saccharicrinis aurantiacus]